MAVLVGAVLGRVRIPGDGVVFTVADLACHLAVPDQAPVAGDDADDVAWVDAPLLAALDCTPGLVEALAGWDALPR